MNDQVNKQKSPCVLQHFVSFGATGKNGELSVRIYSQLKYRNKVGHMASLFWCNLGTTVIEMPE